MKINKMKCLGVLALCSSPAFSQPFSTLDARSMAMGDTGVASASVGTAGIFNPALLSRAADDENVHIVVPNFGVEAFADPDALDAFENIEDEAYIDDIESGINRMENAFSELEFLAGRDELSRGASGLNRELSELSEKPFRINAAVFGSVSIPAETIGVSVFLNANATIETSPFISQCDNEILDQYVDVFDSVNSESDLIALAASGVPPAVNCSDGSASFDILTPTPNAITPTGVAITDPIDDLTSQVLVAGVTVTELGLALAREFEIAGKNISIGITPKLQSITSYYAAPTVQQLDEESYDVGDELEDSEKDDDVFNLDVGIATTFLPNDALTVGLVVKNLVAQSFTTSDFLSDGETSSLSFDLDTQIRAGLSWDAPLGVTLAADLDLLKNEAYFLGEDTQFLGLGAEWDVFNTLRLRGGYRTNLADGDDKVLTAGIGFNIVALYLDLGVQASENNAGVGFQLGLAF